MPITVTAPLCFQQGVPGVIDFEGGDVDHARNWRLITDNGTVSGREVTPAKVGTMSLSLEIDGPITRQSDRLDPAKPRTTKVALGIFSVLSDNCMIRLTFSPAGGGQRSVHTFSFDGEYTEIAVDANTAVYWSADNMAIY